MASRAFLIGQYLFAFAVGGVALWDLDAPVWAYAVLTAVLAPPPFLFGRSTADVLLKVFMPAVIGAAAVLLYVRAHDMPVLSDVLMTTASADSIDAFQFFGEQYYAVLSTLFAIITALILVKGIESFDRLNQAILEEANVIRSIVEFLRYFMDPDSAPANRENVDAVRRAMATYCQNFLKSRGAAAVSTNFDMIRLAAAQIGRLDCKDRNDEIALSEVMRALNMLFTVRARRIACSETKIPFYMIVTLSLMSIAIIAPFFIGSEGPQIFNAISIFVLTAFCVFILLLLNDINSPFDGFWRVETRAFEELLEALNKPLEDEYI